MFSLKFLAVFGLAVASASLANGENIAETLLAARNWNEFLGAKNVFSPSLSSSSVLSSTKSKEAVLEELTQLLAKSDVIDQLYKNYLTSYEKTERLSDTKNQADLRKSIFKGKLLEAAEHNAEAAAGKWTWFKAINAFSDLSDEEFQTMYAGYAVAVNTSEYEKLDINYQLGQSDSKNWNDEGYVTRVKNQGSCGSCYAFASIAALESAYAIKWGKQYLYEWSEQELVDCSSNGACGGGNSPKSWDYIKQNGIAWSNDYPYTSDNGRAGNCQAGGKKHYAYIRDYRWVQSENDLAGAINQYGPVSILINSRDWNSYGGGVFQRCNQRLDGSGNHLVAAVGYTRDAWILKNSWGNWGENGYMRMARGCNSCDITSNLFAISAMT